MRSLLAITLVLVCSSALAESTLENRKFKGARLQDVLSLYIEAGYHLTFSTNFVRSDMRIDVEPPEGDAVERLRQMLSAFDLELKLSGRERVLLVARRPPQNPLNLQICDQQDHRPLANASVSNQRVTFTSDDDGRVAVNIEEGASDTWTVSYGNHRSVQVSLDESLPPDCSIVLPQMPRIEEVIVSSSRYKIGSGIGNQTSINQEAMRPISELGGDSLRIMNRLPGAASIGISAKPYIRGGDRDELLVRFNNIELIEPFHLKDFQSVFSSLNPSLIETINVYTGGFPARYGNRMSGVMDILPRYATERTNVELGISFLSLSAQASGRLPNRNGSWTVSARRGTLDWVTQAINPEVGRPTYYDGLSMVEWTTASGVDMDAGVLAYDDDVKLRSIDEGEGAIAQSKYANRYGWIQARMALSEHLESRTLLSFGMIDHDRSGILNDPNPDESVGFLEDRRQFNILRLEQHFQSALSDEHYLEFGGDLSYGDASYRYKSDVVLGELSLLLGAQSRNISRLIAEDPEGLSGSVFATHRYAPTAYFAVESGLRWDWQDYGSSGFSQQLSPRFNVAYTLPNGTLLKLGLGRFYQPQSINELQVEDGIGRFQRSQHADHGVISLEHQWELGLELRLESYYKKISNPKLRFENLFNPLVLLPELSPDRVAVTSERARARGFEATLNYRSPPFTGWLTASHAKAEDRLETGWVPRAWDQKYTISSGLMYERGPLQLSAAVSWHSGWQTTRLPQTTASLDQRLAFRRNRTALSNFFSLDTRISYEWKSPRQSLLLYAEFTNTTGRENVGAIEYEIETHATNGFALTPQEETLFPLVPNVGILWRFSP